MGSAPDFGETVACKTYSIAERPPFMEAGRRPGRRKLNGKLCSPAKR